MFWWRDSLRSADAPGRVVDVAFTDAGKPPAGGRDALGSHNLGLSVGDDPDRVLGNRGAVAAALDLEPNALRFMHQVHGTHISFVADRSAQTSPERCDGQVSRTPGLGLAVLVADCTPVLLVDLAAGVIGAVHAGRPGMTSGVVGAALDSMTAAGARAPSAVVGPSVCARCYEVPWQMREDAAGVSPESRAVSWTGTPAIDVAAGVVAQLHARDVPVTWVPGCTRESDRLYSHRRDPASGRFAGVVVLREDAA